MGYHLSPLLSDIVIKMNAKTYTAVFAVLAAATLLELWIAGLEIARWTMIQAMLALAAVKILLISLYYMHLRYEWRSASILALPALALIAALSIAILMG